MTAPNIDDDVMEKAQFVYDAYSCFCENESDDLKRIDGCIDLIARALQAARNEERERWQLALTPSAETKAAYIGEFSFRFPIRDMDGEEVMFSPNVPWTTIKEIMAAIRSYATAIREGK